MKHRLRCLLCIALVIIVQPLLLLVIVLEAFPAVAWRDLRRELVADIVLTLEALKTLSQGVWRGKV